MKNEAMKVFARNNDVILEAWMQSQLSEEGLRDDLMTNEDLRVQSEELLALFIKSLNDTSIDRADSNDFEAVIDLLSSISMSRAQSGFSPREIGTYIFSLKNALLKTLQKEISNPETLFAQSMKVGNLFDSFSISTFEMYIKGREDVILRQTNEMTEISIPVIQVWDGILALPIIGTLDSSRTQVVMENLLQQIVETGSSIAILDISGVPAVDSLVAQHLMKTVSATRLMGAECIISGIRPEIAQTVVHLGIDLGSIITKATLASALKLAFSIRQLQVTQKG
jgi:rsbT co-antagonist protein RsbR